MKMGIRTATIYGWLDNYRENGCAAYNEKKRGRPFMDGIRRSPWYKWVRKQRQAYRGPGRWEPQLPEQIDLYRSHEFRYDIRTLVYIRHQLKKLGIREDDAGKLSDRAFLLEQYILSRPSELEWRRYCMFLLGGKWGCERRHFIAQQWKQYLPSDFRRRTVSIYKKNFARYE